MRFNVRLSQKDGEKLEELASKRGVNASDLIRDLIRADHDRQAVTDALQELRTAAGNLATFKGGANSKETAEILRIVRIIAGVMPAAAKQL